MRVREDMDKMKEGVRRKQSGRLKLKEDMNKEGWRGMMEGEMTNQEEWNKNTE